MVTVYNSVDANTEDKIISTNNSDQSFYIDNNRIIIEDQGINDNDTVIYEPKDKKEYKSKEVM